MYNIRDPELYMFKRFITNGKLFDRCDGEHLIDLPLIGEK